MSSPLDVGPERSVGQQRRSKVDIYAAILEVTRRYPGGARVTRVSYGVGVPIDRLKPMIEELADYGLVRSEMAEGETRYMATPRGADFLETYWKMNGFLETFSDEPTRGLAAIMFTDMVGYTAAAQRDEKLALTLLAQQRAVVRSQLARYHGREVKTMGDAFLVEFPSALDASLCAVDIQREMSKRNETADAATKVFLRIGIHVGDVERNGDDIMGDAVNLASRIQTASEPGGVCISRQVFDQVWNKLGYHLTELGFREMKNVVGEVEVFRVDLPKREEAKAPGVGFEPTRPEGHGLSRPAQ